MLIVATNLEEGVSALNLYRKRWGIEYLFADAKTRDLNTEDTPITDPGKLATLLVVVALAVTDTYRCATRAMGRTAIPRKTHGRHETSCPTQLEQWISGYFLISIRYGSRGAC